MSREIRTFTARFESKEGATTFCTEVLSAKQNGLFKVVTACCDEGCDRNVTVKTAFDVAPVYMTELFKLADKHRVLSVEF